MKVSASHIPYRETGYFTEIVLDYIAQSPKLKEFYTHTPNWNGLQDALDAKKNSSVDRESLVKVLEEQYTGIETTDAVKQHIQQLRSTTTFSICTAHQPNIFTGHLYAIYKVAHAIKLAEACREKFPGHYFVPVYYMGSEDADLEELGHIFLNGEKLVWDTKQTGAVGRMKIDKAALDLLNRIAGELEVQPFGKELLQILRSCYITGKTMQQASLELFNTLFGKYGLIVLIADHAALKKSMRQIFSDDLFAHTPSNIVNATSQRLAQQYKAQAHVRDINLFYLVDNKRERIERHGELFEVLNSDIRFSEEALKKELEEHPERFSPNVILRGIYQEKILPNIAFIGGGGELAYWLQFRDLFEQYQVPFPVLVLRNSFLVVEEKWQKKMDALGLSLPEIFLNEQELGTAYVKRNSEHPVSLSAELQQATAFYEQLKTLAGKTDATLLAHVASLEKKAVHRLQELEKKMLRAEKRTFSDAMAQIKKLKNALFPNNSLQERIDNFMPGYARFGSGFIDMVHEYSLAIDAEFTVLFPADNAD